jgi:hypothetical protein
MVECGNCAVLAGVVRVEVLSVCIVVVKVCVVVYTRIA